MTEEKKVIASKFKVCTRCLISKSNVEFSRDSKNIDKLNKHCKQCRNIVCANYRSSHKSEHTIYARERRRKYLDKERARQKVKYAVKTGKITRLSCAVCGTPDTEGHHSDYTKPLEVLWLCIKHHNEEHINIKNRTGVNIYE